MPARNGVGIVTWGALSGARLHDRERIAFLERLAELTASGYTEADALAVAATSKSRIGSVARLAVKSVSNGTAFSTAVGTAAALEGADRAILSAGERGGRLPDALALLTSELADRRAQKHALASALAYPCFLAASCSMALVLIGTTVVPATAELTAANGGTVPAASIVLMQSSRAAVFHAPSLAAGACALFTTLAVARTKSKSARDAVDAVVLRLPLIGAVVALRNVAPAYRLASIVVRMDGDLIAGLRAAAAAARNAVVRKRLSAAASLVERGGKLSSVIGRVGLALDDGDASMLELGEATGNYADALARLAAAHGREAENRMRRGLRVVEPVSVILIALGAAAAAVGVYQPIFAASDALLATTAR